MDSLTQIALGAAVGVAVMRRRTAPWKAALWGAVAGTLPDLDVLIDQGDPILDMVLHRAQSHAPFWLTLLSVPLSAAVAALHRELHQWRRWWLALWLALVTHPLLDALTVYGTQLALPFSDHPFGLGTVFVIDPLVTLPWVIGVVWTLAARGSTAGLRANSVGLLLGLAYLGFGMVAHQHVQRVAAVSLAAQGIVAERVLVSPAAFSSVLWRVLVVSASGEHHYEGFRSLLDAPPTMAFERFDRGAALEAALQGHDGVRRLKAFSHGFYKLQQDGARVFITDLRFGVEPHYTFRFQVAESASPLRLLPVAQAAGSRPDLAVVLPWWWRRLGGELLPPPR